MLLALTGATGFLGRHLVPLALGAGDQVRALVRAGRVLPPRDGLQLVEGDLGDRDALLRLVDGVDVVLHLAALGVQGRDRAADLMQQVNVAGTLHLAEAMASKGVRRLVATGTVLEHAPEDPYGQSKAECCRRLGDAADRLGLQGWYLRLASLYGPADDPQKLLPAAIRAAQASQPFEMTPGGQVREWLHVSDAVEAVVKAARMSAQPRFQVADVGTGVGVTLLELVQQVFATVGASRNLIRAGAKPYRSGEVMRLVVGSEEAGRFLGWAPTIGLSEGLREVIGR